jgi:hypothetical protein
MIRLAVRGLIVASLGAVAGAACVIAAYGAGPGLLLEMDRDLPRRLVSGFYPPERAGDLTFAWTGREAAVELPGLDRRMPWTCVLRFRGGGPDLPSRPVVQVGGDGVTLASAAAPIDFVDLRVSVPARSSRPGLSLTFTSSSTFVPGLEDQRELALQVDRLECRPDSVLLVLAPWRAIRNAALAGAAVGAAVGLAGIAIPSAAAGLLALSAGLAILLSTGLAPYGDFTRRMVEFAVWIAAVSVALIKLRETWTRQALGRAARFVIFFSAAALYLKVLGLVHPSKLAIDALFHAHRLGWVLSGRYYFTQPLPSGVSFPYAIGLYLFASPWTFLTSDYVTLLRVIVTACDAAAGALLYLMIVRAWGNRLAGALSVVLFHVIPLPYGMLGNANLTNLFGQSVALTTIAAATVWSLRVRQAGQILALFALSALAFLAHVSTFPLLFVAMLGIAHFYWRRGGPDLRVTSYAILTVAIAAAIFSVVTYYGHFQEVYETALRGRASASASTPAGQQEGDGAGPSAAAPRTGTGTGLRGRARVVVDDTLATIGWPVLILTGIGIWRLWHDGARDRLTLVLLAWGVTYLLFLGVGLLTPVDPRLQRYANEFVGRVNLAAYPAAALLAARGAAWMWKAGRLPALASGAFIVVAVTEGIRAWLGWIR